MGLNFLLSRRCAWHCGSEKTHRYHKNKKSVKSTQIGEIIKNEMER